MGKDSKISSCEKRCQSLKGDLANVNAKLKHLDTAIRTLADALRRRDALNSELARMLVNDNWTGTRYSQFSDSLRKGGSIRDKSNQYFKAVTDIKSALEKQEQALSTQATNIAGQLNKARRDLATAQKELADSHFSK